MLHVACPACHARYKLPEAVAGKRTACKKCGQLMRIPVPRTGAPATQSPPRQPGQVEHFEPPIELSDLDALAGGEAVEMPRPAAQAHTPVPHGSSGTRSASSGVAASPVYAAEHSPPATDVGAYAHYLTAVAKTLLFFRRPGNLITVILLWMLLALRELMQSMRTASAWTGIMSGALLGLAAFVISGWYMAFRLNVVVSAAGEEEELPGFGVEEGWWDGVVIPFRQMLCTYILVLVPIVVFAIILCARISIAATQNTAVLLTGATPTPGGSALAALVLLSLGALFIWPMMVLVVACGGGIFAMFRLDLIFATIAKSLPAYLMTVLMVYIACGVQAVLTAFVWVRVSSLTNWRDDWMAVLILPSLFVGIYLYFDIVAMRAIGFYYACFKHRFAWSWG